MKKTVESHIMARNTAKDISQPFTIEEISTVVERLLHRHCFDRRRQRRRHKYQDDDDSESDSSDESDFDSSDSDDSDYDPKPTKDKASKCTKPTTKPNKRQTKSQPLSEQTNKTKDEVKTSKKSSNDINILVQQMSKLNISDPSYAQAYFKRLLSTH
jgi:cytoskeletal protein RodZ